MLLDQDDKEGHVDNNNDQGFFLKNYLMTELKKSKSEIVVAVEEWNTDDDPSEYNFSISDILNV